MGEESVMLEWGWPVLEREVLIEAMGTKNERNLLMDAMVVPPFTMFLDYVNKHIGDLHQDTLTFLLTIFKKD
jgi:hypothetical protein